MGHLPGLDSEQTEHENIFGGRHWTSTESLEFILKMLKDGGASLVFFFDGSPQDEKLVEWKNRRDEKYKKQVDLMRLIKGGNQTVSSVRDARLIGGNFLFNRNLLTVVKASCEKFGRVYISEKNECEREIMSFVWNNPGVIGLFAKDSDFSIFPGPDSFRYFSSSSTVYRLKRKILTAMEYPRAKLSEKLGLNNLQMAVFATLCGNGYMQYDNVGLIQRKLLGSDNPDHVDEGKFSRLYKIADFVRNYFKKMVQPMVLWETLHAYIIDNIDDENENDVEMLATVESESFKDKFVGSIKFYMCNKGLTLTSDEFSAAFSNNLNYKVLNNMKKSIIP